MCRSETMKENWKDPEFRAKTLKAKKAAMDRIMRERLLELATQGGKTE